MLAAGAGHNRNSVERFRLGATINRFRRFGAESTEYLHYFSCRGERTRKVSHTVLTLETSLPWRSWLLADTDRFKAIF